MSAYADRDDLGLWLSFIKSVAVDLTSGSVSFVLAKPLNHSEATLRYVETQLVLHKVREMHFPQNVNEATTPEFNRSAILTDHPNYELRQDETLYYFGVDWGAEYCEWYFVARDHILSALSDPVMGAELEWVI